MSNDMQIKGVGKPIGNANSRMGKVSQFEEMLRESEQLILDANFREDDEMLNPDMSFSIKSISSVHLDANPKFKDLKRCLENYHLDYRRKRSLLHPERSTQWRHIVYTSLHKLLNECVFTSTRKLQLEYLDKVFDWYYNKVGTILSDKKPEQPRPKLEIDIDSSPERLLQYSRRMITTRPKTAKSAQPIKSETKSFRLSSQAFSGAGDPQQTLRVHEGVFTSFAPVSDFEEKKAEERFKENRRKDLIEKRLKDEMKGKINIWTVKRARKAEEFTRKSESTRYASRFEQSAYTARILKEPPGSKRVYDMIDREEPKSRISGEEVEDDQPMHKLNKIEAIRKIHENILAVSTNYDEISNALENDPKAITLSAFTKGSKVWKKDCGRPNTAGYLPPARNIITKGLSGPSRPMTASRTKQIDEIYEVKMRLAKKNIACSIDTLRNALLMPEDLPSEALTHLTLPLPGSRLISNPLLKLAKTKSKKGKKSKKTKKN